MRAIFTGCDCPTVCNSTYSQIQSGTTRAGGPLLPIAPRPRRTVRLVLSPNPSSAEVLCVLNTVALVLSRVGPRFLGFSQSDGRWVWQPRPFWMTLAGMP